MTGHARADTGSLLARLLDRPATCTLAAGLAGALISAGLLAAGWPHRPATRQPSQSAASGFLAAWQRHLSGSWSVDEVEQRATTAGATISYRIHEAQRPPDSVFIGGTTVSARRGQVLLACATPPDSTAPVCRESPTTQTWAENVATDVSALRSYLSGPSAVYSVTDLGRYCFALTLRDPGAAARLPVFVDRGARYCFDPGTYALRLSVIQRVGAVDTTTAVTLRSPASDADLALPAGAR